MKVIFLDIDGVLKNAFGDKLMRREFEPRAVRALNELTRASGAKIVISSSWREIGWDLQRIFNFNQVEGEIIGNTPVLPGHIRGLEIEAWLDTAVKPVTNYVILDDDDDMGSVKGHLVQTDPQRCLTRDDVRRALGVLDLRLRG